jgi:hypothetical protein
MYKNVYADSGIKPFWSLVSNRLICRGLGLKRRVSKFVIDSGETRRGTSGLLSSTDQARCLKSQLDTSTLSKRTVKYTNTILSRKENCSSSGLHGDSLFYLFICLLSSWVSV